MSETKYASINLLPRKEFEITLIDGTIIKGQFGTWSLKRFCDKKNLTLGQLQAAGANDYTVGDIVELILCAVEQKARQDNAPFSYTDVHCCMWIDELGGWSDTKVTSLFNHQASDIEQKKTEVIQPDLTGPESSEYSTPPA